MIHRQDILRRAKSTLEHGRAHIREQFLKGESTGHETADALAILMDETLQFIWHEVGMGLNVDLADHLALMAVGGYGRGQRPQGQPGAGTQPPLPIL